MRSRLNIPRNVLVISVTRFEVFMRVEVIYENDNLIFESESPTTISSILTELDIPSSTVLAVFNDTIVPHSSIINEDLKIELVVVSSGG
jgi:sulfur carrier protein ThiS